jgi:undecaprenyl-diphosphatase
MPDWIAVVILGVIEGITEFLPISSTGHLVVAEHWLKPRTELFNVVIQCGAVLAVLLVFTQRLKQLSLGWREPATRDYLGKLAAAFLLTAIGGLLLKKLGLKLSDNATVVTTTTLLGGVLILAVERWLRGRQLSDEITWPMAIAVGAAQLVAAAFPGTSRSGATILVALAFGLARPQATEFSFLLGIPTLLAAGGYEIFSSWRHDEIGKENWSMVLLGAIVAAVTAFVAVKWLLRYVQSHTFVAFGWYRIALAIAILLLLLA